MPCVVSHGAHQTLPHPLGAAIQAPRYRRCGTVLPPSSAPLGGPRVAHAQAPASTSAAYRLCREPPANRASADDVGAHHEEGTDHVLPVSQLCRLETGRCRPHVLEADVRPARTTPPPEAGKLCRPSPRGHIRPPIPPWHSSRPARHPGTPPTPSPRRVEVQCRVSVRGALCLSFPLSKRLQRRHTVHIKNRDINPSYVGAMHCCKAPLWVTRLDLDSRPQFAQRPLLLL